MVKTYDFCNFYKIVLPCECIAKTSSRNLEGICINFLIVTNYRKLGCLNQHNFIILTVLEVRGPEWQNKQKRSRNGFHGLEPRCQWDSISFGGFMGESISFPFSASRGCLHSWLLVPFFHLQSNQDSIFKSFWHTSSCLPFIKGSL